MSIGSPIGGERSHKGCGDATRLCGICGTSAGPTRLKHVALKGIPRWLFGQVFLLEAWGTKANNTIRFLETSVFFGLAAFGGKAKKPLVSGKRVVYWPCYPTGLQKNTWPTNHFGIPLMTQLYLRMLFNFSGPPPPGVSGGGVRTVIILRKSIVLGRSRPGSRRKFDFDFDLKWGWVDDGSGTKA